MTGLKAEYINPFIDATRVTFSMMVGMEIVRETVSLKSASARNNDISGIIGLAGDVSGSVVLNFPFTTAGGVVSRFLDMPIADPHDYEVLDAIGELTNIVAGNAKSNIANSGLRVELGLPTIIIGKGHQVSRPRNVPTVAIEWSCDAGSFVLEVCLRVEG